MASSASISVLGGLLESFPIHQRPYRYILLYLALILIANRLTDCHFVDADDSVPQYDVLTNFYRLHACGPREFWTFRLSPRERQIMFALEILGIFGFVLPHLLQRDGAARHFANAKVLRVLIVHVCLGGIVVLAYPILGMFGGIDKDGVFMKVLMALDLLHCITAIRLLKNHDGTFALRIGNFLAVITKYLVWVNLARHDNDDKHGVVDLLFVVSFGFMGSRIAAVMGAVACLMTGSGDAYFLEHYYSVGVALAQFHSILRIPGAIKIWLSTAPLVSFVYYHELWRQSTRMRFVAINVVGSCLALAFLNQYAQLAYIVLYHLYCFSMPIFYRMPAMAAAGTVEEYKISQDKGLAMIYRRTSVAATDVMKSFHMGHAETTVGSSRLGRTNESGKMTFGSGSAWVPSISYRLLGDEDEVTELLRNVEEEDQQGEKED